MPSRSARARGGQLILGPADHNRVAGGMTAPSARVWAVAAVPLPAGRVLLASAGLDGTVRRWDPLTGDPVGDSLTGHTNGVWAVAAVPLPNGRVLLASAGDNGTDAVTTSSTSPAVYA